MSKFNPWNASLQHQLDHMEREHDRISLYKHKSSEEKRKRRKSSKPVSAEKLVQIDSDILADEAWESNKFIESHKVEDVELNWFKMNNGELVCIAHKLVHDGYSDYFGLKYTLVERYYIKDEDRFLTSSKVVAPGLVRFNHALIANEIKAVLHNTHDAIKRRQADSRCTCNYECAYCPYGKCILSK